MTLFKNILIIILVMISIFILWINIEKINKGCPPGEVLVRGAATFVCVIGSQP